MIATKGKYTWPTPQWTLMQQKKLSEELVKSNPLPPPIKDIPDQVMNIILPRLTIKVAVQMRLVSHRWNDCVMKHLKSKLVKNSSLTVIVQNKDSTSSSNNFLSKSEEYVNKQFLVDDCDKPFCTSKVVPEIIGEIINVKFSKMDVFAQYIKATLGKNVQNLIVYIVNSDSKVKIKMLFNSKFKT